MKNIHPIGRQEILTSRVILILLSGIAFAIFSAQFRHNPAVESIPIPKAAQSLQSIVPTPDMLTILSPPEQFDAAALSDKIDGKAELYLSAGFKQLQCQRFSEKGHPNLWMEIFIFEMQNPSGAFAVFSTQRREDGKPLDIVPLSYRTQNAFYLTHGSYYIEIIASSVSEQLFKGMENILKNFVQSKQGSKTAMTETELFPKNDLSYDSITLMSSDVFGYDALNNVFTAKYSVDNNVFTAFLSKRQSPEDAQKLLSGYSQFLMNFGGKEADLAIQGCKMVEIMDNYELICSHGNIFFGIHEAQNKEAAQKLVALLKKHLEEKSREQ